MFTKTTFLFGATLFFVGSALIPVTGVAQDNPNVDNTVGLNLPSMSPRGGNAVNVITTQDGYDNFDLGTTNSEPHMSSNPLNPPWYFNAFNTNTTFHTENGTTWTTNNPAFPTAAGDPVSAYDSLGNLYYETMKSPITGCWVVKSTNNGATWGTAVSAVVGNDRNWMACDQTMGPYANYIYSTMTPGNFSRSTDGGATFTQTATLAAQSLPGMMVAVGPNVLGGNNISGGCVYAVTHSGTNALGIYTFYVSTNGGVTFTQKSTNQFSNLIGTELGGRSTVQGMRCRPYPMIAADNSYGPNRGRFYLVYASNSPAGNGNKSDIFLRYSTDQGTTWSVATVVNDDPNSQNNFQFHPAIWCDKETGRLYIKFYDTRLVPTSDSMDVYATYTDNGGATFAPNQRLTNRTFKINFSGGAGPTYRGDYDAITSNRDASLSVWADFRNNNYLGMTAYFPDFAMLLSQNSMLLGLTDSATVRVRVPSVKLYTGVAKFSATVSPAAPFTFTFLNGRDSLTSYPDSVSLRVRSNNVPVGTYTVTVTGQGRNGTPVHRRTLTVTVSSANAVAVSTPNGGETWTYGSPNNITWGRTGVVDSVRIEYSTDNGTSWATITPGVPASPASYAWTVPNTPTIQARVRISWTDSASISDQSDAAFTIVVAQGWTAQTSGITNQFYSVKAVSPTVAWAAAVGGRVLRTTNGGTTWTSVGGGRIGAADVYNITAVDANTAFVTTSPAATYIFRTTNGGVVWDTVYSLAGGFIDAMHMYDATNGIAVGDPTGGPYVILKTSNGGATWARIATEPTPGAGEASSQNDLCVFGPNNIWFGASANGKVYRSTDAGATWLSSTVPGAVAATNVIGVWFNSAQYGIASVANGATYTAFRSTDGGASWTAITVGTAGYNIAVSGSGTDNFWMGRGTNIFRSGDRGATWSQSYTGTGTFYDADFRTSGSTTYGWGVKDNGNIVFFFGSLTGIEERPQPSGTVPQQVALLQNYPNPFNPSTTISYELPMQATVQLKIFNMLGQEITTLVDAPQPGGTHSSSWTGNSDAGHAVSSGMYVYRLEAKTADGKTITSVKKMLLLR